MRPAVCRSLFTGPLSQENVVADPLRIRKVARKVGEERTGVFVGITEQNALVRQTPHPNQIGSWEGGIQNEGDASVPKSSKQRPPPLGAKNIVGIGDRNSRRSEEEPLPLRLAGYTCHRGAEEDDVGNPLSSRLTKHGMEARSVQVQIEKEKPTVFACPTPEKPDYGLSRIAPLLKRGTLAREK